MCASPKSEAKSILTLYTLGYQKRPIEEFVEILRDSAVDVLVDVRENAWSYKRGFSKTAFSEALAEEGIKYVHASFAGNPKRIRDEAESHADCLRDYSNYLCGRPAILEQLSDLLKPLLEERKSICMTCYERHPADCHRSILLSEWVRREGDDVKINHLATEGAERFIQTEAHSVS